MSFRKQGSNTTKLAMIRLREEMQREKPNIRCTHIRGIFFYNFNIWANGVRHCEELIREDWK
jgi:hypothetical protein